MALVRIEKTGLGWSGSVANKTFRKPNVMPAKPAKQKNCPNLSEAAKSRWACFSIYFRVDRKGLEFTKVLQIALEFRSVQIAPALVKYNQCHTSHLRSQFIA